MIADVKSFIRECRVCQQVKHVTRKSAGLLQPISPPTGIWEDLSMDFITHLPSSHSFTVILVVVDRFSKGPHLGALPTQFTAFKVATLFLDIVCKLHGFPSSIISDRDPVFINSFWRELFKLSGTTLRMTTAYHPQSDGQTEVMNRSVEQYLRSFVHKRPKEWHKFLPFAEWAYNTSQHSRTGVTPYEVIYGKPPPSVPGYVLGSSRNEAVDTLLHSRAELHESLRRKLLKAQAEMKHFADKKRRDVQYEIGQLVYVKLRPHRQLSLRSQRHHKLMKRYFGPFPILERIGSVAYRLQLPEGSRIHPVFHCSLLRPHHGPLDLPTSSLPADTSSPHPILEPLAILDSRMDFSVDPPTRFVLVQWVGLPPEDSTWEKWDDVCHAHHLEDKVSFTGSDDVSSSNTTKEDSSHDEPVPQRQRSSTRPKHLEDYVL